MKVESISLKGSNPYNEDRLVANEDHSLYAVFDGCSSIVKWRSESGETGGSLAARIAAETFERADREESLLGIAKRANEHIERGMSAKGIERPIKEERWGTVLVAARLSEDTLEYIQIGDCMAFAIYRGGIIRPLTYPQVGHLEINSLLKWKEGIGNGLKTVKELSDYTAATVRSNRKLSNTREGYGVLNGEPEAENFLEYGKIHIGQLEHLILVTDGLFWPEKDPEPETDWSQTVQGILEHGLEAYAKSILQMEEKDQGGQTYIRLKKSDDKTGIVLHF